MLSLDHAANIRVQVRTRAFTYPGMRPQRLGLVVNGHEMPGQPIGAEWQTLIFEVAAGAWRGGVNRVELAFDHAATPAEVGIGGDARRLSASVDYVRIEVVE
jgi:hypothetical protein